MNLTRGFLVLTVSALFMMSFGSYVFAQEVTIQKPPLSLGGNHFGSMIKTQTVSSDGSIWIFLTTTEPVEREHMTINVRFTDENGKQVNGINYDIIATQNEQIILSETMVHQRIGIGDHLTQALPSDDAVNVKITLQGIGTNPPFTGPQGESIQIIAVPEFGTVAMIILGISILSIVMISKKGTLSFLSQKYTV
ncbi:MAG: PEFG-CTERM sorting domain-containing protein [Nitrosarchaeum sp.]|nr:PEFG-CTERM sorting domain-containing protein [Nitrosarchaeum sp.]